MVAGRGSSLQALIVEPLMDEGKPFHFLSLSSSSLPARALRSFPLTLLVRPEHPAFKVREPNYKALGKRVEGASFPLLLQYEG